jgi:hypothetical protein
MIGLIIALYLALCGLGVFFIDNYDYDGIYPIFFPFLYIFLNVLRLPKWLGLILGIIVSILAIGTVIWVVLAFLFMSMVVIVAEVIENLHK